MQLVFFHHAGGSSFSYIELAHKLSAFIEVYCLELAGRGMRVTEPFQVDGEIVLSDILAAIKQLRLGEDKPLLLFGHSLGAELAYQVACRLENELPEKQLALVISARGFNDPEGCINKPFEEYSDSYVLNILEQCEGTPANVLANPALRNYVIKTMKNDLILLDSLSRLPKAKLNIPTCVIGGDRDNRVSVSRLAEWSQVLPVPIEQQIFTGGHFYLFKNNEIVSWIEKQARKLAG
ncbi:Thioesterase [Xenorhabdus kozodoii]|uniref:Thioesterase n=1 Tax=Xenorhabdus kozodoii TaxID=351676 RepID=A0A2D0LE18_9GAMM|nr:Thioesterase [Xenorhabdus kozodoii]